MALKKANLILLNFSEKIIIGMISKNEKNKIFGRFYMSVNKVILVGRLGGDPEVRYTANQQPICSFGLATSERYKDLSLIHI